MGTLGDSLDRAGLGVFTRPTPKTASAQMRYLVKQLRTTRAVAQLLGISPRTVECCVKDQIKRPRPDLAVRLEREVTSRWQPHVRARAKQAAATTGGIVIDTRAPFRLHRRPRHHRRRPPAPDHPGSAAGVRGPALRGPGLRRRRAAATGHDSGRPAGVWPMIANGRSLGTEPQPTLSSDTAAPRGLSAAEIAAVLGE